MGHDEPRRVDPEDATTLEPKDAGMVPHIAAFPLTTRWAKEVMPEPHEAGKVELKELFINAKEDTAVIADHPEGRALLNALYPKESELRESMALHAAGSEP